MEPIYCWAALCTLTNYQLLSRTLFQLPVLLQLQMLGFERKTSEARHVLGTEP